MLLLLLLLLLLRLTTAAHWRNKLIRLPLPYGLVMEAWKARAGASLESTLSHAAVTCTRGGGRVLVEGGVLVEWGAGGGGCKAGGGGSGHLGGHEVALVEQEDEVLVLRLLLEEGLGVRAARADRVARIEHLDQHVGRVDHLVRDGLGLGLGRGRRGVG